MFDRPSRPRRCAQHAPARAAVAAAVLLAGATASAQGAAPPVVKRLPVTGYSIEVPEGWVARATPFGSPGAPPADLVTRTAPGLPTLFVTLVPVAGHTCSEWWAGVSRNLEPGERALASTSFLPAGWFPSATVGPTPGRPANLTAAMCLDAANGLVLGAFEYAGALESPDLRSVTPILASVARAAGGSSGLAAPPPAAPRPAAPPPVAPSPAPTPPSILDSRNKTLNQSGLAVVVPAQWETTTTTQSIEGGLRAVDTFVPGQRGAFHGIHLVPTPVGGACSSLAEAYQPVSNPNIAPGWTLRIAPDGRSHWACLDSPRGAWRAFLVHDVGTPPTVLQAATPVFVALTDAILASTAVAPSRPASTPAPPPPAPAPSGSMPPAAPPYAPSSDGHDDDDDVSDLFRGAGLQAQLGVGYLQPKPGVPEAWIFTFGLEQDEIHGDEFIGFAQSAGLSLGVTTDQNIPFDARGAIGFGVRFWRIRLVPVVGLGTDTMGGGDGGFTVPLAAYWYAEGRVGLGLPWFGLEGIASRHARGSFDGVADEVPVENRLTVQLAKHLADGIAGSVGFRAVDYGRSASLGGVVGVSF
jgi:hypothetical protein